MAERERNGSEPGYHTTEKKQIKKQISKLVQKKNERKENSSHEYIQHIDMKIMI